MKKILEKLYRYQEQICLIIVAAVVVLVPITVSAQTSSTRVITKVGNAPESERPGSGSIFSCQFTRAGSSYSIKSQKLIALIEEVAAKSEVPATAIAGTAMHETQNFVANAQDDHDAFGTDVTAGGLCKHFATPKETGALGLMQVIPPRSIVSFAREDAYDDRGVRIGAQLAGIPFESLTLQHFCDVKTSLYLGAGVLISKNGGRPPQTSGDIKKAICGYYGACTYGGFNYGDEVQRDFERCQASGPTQEPLPGVPTDCPIPSGKVSCGTFYTPINGCGHCGLNYNPDSVRRFCGPFPDTKWGMDIDGVDYQDIFLPKINRHIITWTFREQEPKEQDLSKGSGEAIQKYTGVDEVTRDTYYLQFHHTQPSSGRIPGQSYQSGEVGGKICGVLPSTRQNCGERHVHVQLGSGGGSQADTQWIDVAKYLCRG